MRIKCYIATTMTDAMQLVRDELGDDAVIISTQRGANGKGVRITAALEMPVHEDDDVIQDALTGEADSRTMEAVREALAFHNTPTALIDKLMAAARSVERSEPWRDPTRVVGPRPWGRNSTSRPCRSAMPPGRSC